ncbi:MAG: serine acetyltransferase [Verrucomicrobiota bacterium JB024]|nr:serine acetyltransferase [Verrucomicrobiota bacterium JB024]
MSSTFKETVKADYLRYGKPLTWRMMLYSYIVHPGFRTTLWYRIARHCHQSPRLRPFAKLATLCLIRQQHKTGITINPITDIGPGLYIPHPGCIVINPHCKIGRNLYLSHDVLLGKAHAGARQGSPEVGDDVFLGAGARLLGKLTIGDNAAIGANAVVITDIPPNTFAAGAPAKVVKNIGAREILGIQEGSEYA